MMKTPRKADPLRSANKKKSPATLKQDISDKPWEGKTTQTNLVLDFDLLKLSSSHSKCSWKRNKKNTDKNGLNSITRFLISTKFLKDRIEILVTFEILR